MIGHSIILVTLGLAIACGIVWRLRVVKDVPFSSNLADLIISLYLLASGVLMMIQYAGNLNYLSNQAPAAIFLLLPTAISASRLNAPGQRQPSTLLWSVIGLALAGYFVLLNSQWSPLGISTDSPALFATIFLFSSTLFFKRYYRFILGLATIVWIIEFAHINSMGSTGIGIVIGAISFSSIINSAHIPDLAFFDFSLRDFIRSLGNPCLVLDLSGVTIYCNEQFIAISGRHKEEILGKDAIDMFDIPPLWRFRLGPAERNKSVRCSLLSADAERIPVQLILSEIRNSHGELKNLLCEVFEQREREHLESRLKNESVRFASLYETSQALSSSLELKDVLKSIARAAENLTRADSCTICTLDQSRRTLRPVYSSEEEYNAEVMNFEISVGSGLTGSVVADGKSRIQNFDDASKVAVHIPGTSEEEEESLLSMPLVVKDSVIGALTLYKVGRRRFEQDDLKSLTVFASQAAAIIETSRLYMKLKTSERLYRHSVDLAGDAILFVDFESGRITDANEMALKLFKYPKVELLSMRVWELNRESQMHITKKLWEEVKQTGWGRLGDIDYHLKDGSEIPASVNVSAIQNGELNSIQWMVRDIGEYKRSIEKLGFFHQLFERLEEPIMLTNNRGKILYSNRSFREVFGLTGEEASLGDVASINLQGSRLDSLNSCWGRLKGKSHLIAEINIEFDGRAPKKKTVSVLPHRNTKGEIKYFVWLFHPPMEAIVMESQDEVAVAK